MPDKTILKSLLYSHLEYQQLVHEGCTDTAQNIAFYTKWADYCVITVITPTYIQVDLPSKSNGLLVSRYEDHEINTGLWVCIADFGKDTDCYYWCRNHVIAKLRELVCMLTAEGPYLLHTLQVK